MRKLLAAAAVAAVASTGASAQTVKLGILMGYTGPLESLIPDMSAAAELAIREVSDSGALLGGAKVAAVKGDSTCIDNAAATSAAERLVTSDKVDGIVGGDCSGVTGAVLQNVARPHGVVMVSPSATSPGLSTAADDGLFFRTAPSDARQGVVMTDVIMDRGYRKVALTYSNTDYGKGLANSFKSAFEKAGGTVTINASHEDDKADYASEVASLAAAGGDVLVVAGYIDKGGLGIIRGALDKDAFDRFVLPDGMIGESIVKNVGPDLDGSFGQHPGTDSEGAGIIDEMVKRHGTKPGPFVAESYDAAALILLAMQAAKSTDSKVYKDRILEVANAPGEKILPGELGKALKILAAGGDVDYVGGSAVELIGPGESKGNYREIEVRNGKIETVRYR